MKWLDFSIRGLAVGGGFQKRQLESPGPNDALNWNTYDTDHFVEDNGWELGTTKYELNEWQNQPYVANGYHGSRLTSAGIGYYRIQNETGSTQPINGWPLDNARQTFATITGFWDAQPNTTRTNFPELLEDGYESVISGIPTWTSFYIATKDGKYVYGPGVPKEQLVLEDDKGRPGYRQRLSLRNGIVDTYVRWQPTEDVGFNIHISVLAHRKRKNLGMIKIQITPDNDAEVLLVDVLDGAGAQRTSFKEKKFLESENGIWTSVNPTGIDNVSAYVYSTVDFPSIETYDEYNAVEKSRKDAKDRQFVSTNSSTISQEFSTTLKGNKTFVIQKYVGIASSDAFKYPFDEAKKAAEQAKKVSWGSLVEEHIDAWEELWDQGEVMVHDEKYANLQTSFRASLFHLLSNVRSAEEGTGVGDNSISVGGLASDSYAGLVFWDADLWMFPGLLALHPQYAEAINNYRYKLLNQAKLNAQQYGLDGVLYPWTSGRYGNCTGTGPCVDYQYHLNTDIAWAHFQQWLSSGDKTWLREKGWPIIKGVAEMFASKVKKSNATGADGLQVGFYTISNMTDPDEYANHVNNGAFTNAGIKRLMGMAQSAATTLGITAPPIWSDIEKNMFIPYNREAGIIPEYATMNGSVVIKQADVILINYPLEFRLNDTQANHDLDFYARAQSPDGPAMTWAMFAINALDLSPHGCASHTYSLTASQPYLRAPYYQFSEQIIDDIYANGNTNPAFTFLTGHGGFLQIATHGYTGFRQNLTHLYLDPSLPPQLEKGVTIHDLNHQGASYIIHINPLNTTITRRPDPRVGHRSVATVYIPPRNPGGERTVKLLPGDSFTIPTRRPDLNGADIPGNLAECKPAWSPQPNAPGLFPLAGVDGSNHTTWRCANSSTPCDLIVDLGSTRTFSKVHINWAEWPAERFEVATTDVDPRVDGVEEGEGKEEDWKTVIKEESVELTEVWTEEVALVVRRRVGNWTIASVGEEDEGSAEGRWVRLRVEGDREGKQRGATVGQFAVLE